jgi:hypothetical protein
LIYKEYQLDLSYILDKQKEVLLQVEEKRNIEKMSSLISLHSLKEARTLKTPSKYVKKL